MVKMKADLVKMSIKEIAEYCKSIEQESAAYASWCATELDEALEEKGITEEEFESMFNGEEVQTFIHDGCRITTRNGRWIRECAVCGLTDRKAKNIREEGGMERTVYVTCQCGAKYQFCA
jgi:hypothetical protein